MMDALMKRKANIRYRIRKDGEEYGFPPGESRQLLHGDDRQYEGDFVKILDDGEGLEIKDDGGNLDQGSDIYHRDNHFGKTHIGDVGTLPKEEIKG